MIRPPEDVASSTFLVLLSLVHKAPPLQSGQLYPTTAAFLVCLSHSPGIVNMIGSLSSPMTPFGDSDITIWCQSSTSPMPPLKLRFMLYLKIHLHQWPLMVPCFSFSLRQLQYCSFTPPKPEPSGRFLDNTKFCARLKCSCGLSGLQLCVLTLSK